MTARPAGCSCGARVNIEWLDSETVTDEMLQKVDGIIVPGGFGKRGTVDASVGPHGLTTNITRDPALYLIAAIHKAAGLAVAIVNGKAHTPQHAAYNALTGSYASGHGNQARADARIVFRRLIHREAINAL